MGRNHEKCKNGVTFGRFQVPPRVTRTGVAHANSDATRPGHPLGVHSRGWGIAYRVYIGYEWYIFG